jgi:hypothetical protein
MSSIREIQTTLSNGPPEYCTVQKCSELSQRVAHLESDIKGLFDMFKAEQERTDYHIKQIAGVVFGQPGKAVVYESTGRSIGGSKRRTLKSKRR